MEIIFLNCNKLKIITQYISYNNIYGGRLIREGGLISFFTQKEGLLERGLIREGAYLRGGAK